MSFLPIPAIDLLGGICVRLYQGHYNKATAYATDPIAVAKHFVAAGAKRIHLIDLDGAKAGQPHNRDVIRAVVQGVHRLDPTIQLQVGGGLRTLADMRDLLELGTDYVIIGSVAIAEPELFNEACSSFAGKVLLGVDVRDGNLAINGWTETTQVSALDFAKQTDLQGVAGIIYTDISSDGTLTGPNVQATQAFANTVPCPVYASGGISTLDDISSLRTGTIAGAIIGKAIYTGKIQLDELFSDQSHGNRHSLLSSRVSDSVWDIVPYKGGKTATQLVDQKIAAEPIKLSSNENPLGTGKLALQVLENAAQLGVNQYPDGAALGLRTAIAAQLGISTDTIICGNGSNDILELCATLTLFPGRKAVFSAHAFIVYKLVSLARGATIVEVPTKDFGNDLDALAAASCQPEVGAVYIANPNNPTGTWHAPEELLDFLHKVPLDVLVVLDEAYQEYTGDDPGISLSWLEQFPNLIITRSFSKLHGLAGLRLGYGISNLEILGLLNRIRQPFNANSVAQAAAIAALADHKFITQSQQSNAAGRVQLANGFANLGYVTIPSQANFITFHTPTLEQTYASLLSAGVIVRQISEYGLPNWLRTTIGTAAQNEHLLNALPACHNS